MINRISKNTIFNYTRVTYSKRAKKSAAMAKRVVNSIMSYKDFPLKQQNQLVSKDIFREDMKKLLAMKGEIQNE